MIINEYDKRKPCERHAWLFIIEFPIKRGWNLKDKILIFFIVHSYKPAKLNKYRIK